MCAAGLTCFCVLLGWGYLTYSLQWFWFPSWLDGSSFFLLEKGILGKGLGEDILKNETHHLERSFCSEAKCSIIWGSFFCLLFSSFFFFRRNNPYFTPKNSIPTAFQQDFSRLIHQFIFVVVVDVEASSWSCCCQWLKRNAERHRDEGQTV